ncbi:unnamed protein product [Ilex paraguariensis]|uniref:Pentatricopeptide repeat-containing protein n=1 Tax=Ilex paraguariensis TaxID=185542 RepID=A0ABC8SZR8_9AQUA
MPPTVTALSSILRKCALVSAMSQVKQTHTQILIHCLPHNVTLQTDLLLAYAKSGFLQYARKVFDKMLERNMHSWNIMIASYVQNSLYCDALRVFSGFLKKGLRPDHYTLPPTFKASGEIEYFLLGLMLHSWVIKLGFEDYVVVGSSVLDLYLKWGRLNDAQRVFVNMEWKDPVVCNLMILGFGRAGFYVDALNCFRDMLEENVRMDSMTIPSVLAACGTEGDHTRGKEIHGQAVKSVIFDYDVAIGNALIDMYSKCGCLYYSEKVFWNMSELNLVTWTTMLSCYGAHGRGEDSLVLFEKMRDCGFVPNHVTLTAVLASCSHSGLIDQGRKIFNSVSSVYGIEPGVEHYACVVDLLGRAGCLAEAFGLIENMKLVPTASVWGALLAGCTMHKNVEIGEIAANHLFELEARNSSNYIALCGIYDSLGIQNGVLSIRRKMRELGLFKTPGCSWISIGGNVHRFYQGDVSHPFSQTIYETLDVIFRTRW